MTTAGPHDFFRALDASTRGFWSVYDSSGLLVRAGVLKMINWLRGALHRSKSYLILRELGTRGGGEVPSPGGVTPERSVLLGVARAGSPATSMTARAGDDSKRTVSFWTLIFTATGEGRERRDCQPLDAPIFLRYRDVVHPDADLLERSLPTFAHEPAFYASLGQRECSRPKNPC